MATSFFVHYTDRNSAIQIQEGKGGIQLNPSFAGAHEGDQTTGHADQNPEKGQTDIHVALQLSNFKCFRRYTDGK